MQRQYMTCILLFLLLTPITANCQKTDADGYAYHFREHNLQMTRANDSVIVEDPVTGEQIVHTSNWSAPLTLDGEKIFTTADPNVTPPAFAGKDSSIYRYLVNGLNELLARLPDGDYVIGLDNVVVDGSGNVAYYSYDKEIKSVNISGVSTADGANGKPKLIIIGENEMVTDYWLENDIADRVDALFYNQHLFAPATRSGENVTCRLADLREELILHPIMVRHRKVTGIK